MRTSRPIALLATLALTTALAACGDDSSTAEAPVETPGESTSESSTESPDATASPEASESPESPGASETPDGVVLQALITGGEITPNAQRVEVPLGEEFTLEITSDVPGELHIHSNPEQYVEFEAGTTEAPVTIDVPGVVEVEEHETGILIWSLQVQ